MAVAWSGEPAGDGGGADEDGLVEVGEDGGDAGVGEVEVEAADRWRNGHSSPAGKGGFGCVDAAAEAMPTLGRREDSPREAGRAVYLGF